MLEFWYHNPDQLIEYKLSGFSQLCGKTTWMILPVPSSFRLCVQSLVLIMILRASVDGFWSCYRLRLILRIVDFRSTPEILRPSYQTRHVWRLALFNLRSNAVASPARLLLWHIENVLSSRFSYLPQSHQKKRHSHIYDSIPIAFLIAIWYTGCSSKIWGSYEDLAVSSKTSFFYIRGLFEDLGYFIISRFC